MTRRALVTLTELSSTGGWSERTRPSTVRRSTGQTESGVEGMPLGRGRGRCPGRAASSPRPRAPATPGTPQLRLKSPASTIGSPPLASSSAKDDGRPQLGLRRAPLAEVGQVEVDDHHFLAHVTNTHSVGDAALPRPLDQASAENASAVIQHREPLRDEDRVRLAREQRAKNSRGGRPSAACPRGPAGGASSPRRRPYPSIASRRSSDQRGSS